MNNKIINGGEAVYRVLKQQGVKTVFGLLGGSMLELYDAIYKENEVEYIGARDERAAGHMADAYARMTGGPGIVLGAQAGPGVVNLTTAVAEAHLAYSPLVVIAGAISRTDLGKDTFQEVNQVSLFEPICKRSIMVATPARLADMLNDAIHLAMSGRRGPVVLHVPRDIFSAQVDVPTSEGFRIAKSSQPLSDDIGQILHSIESAASPVIVAGAGIKWSKSWRELQQLVEFLQIPVVASTGHADIMPHGHLLFAGQGGPRGNRVASRLTRDADLLIVLGARLAFNSTFHSHEYISASAKIIQVDIDASAIGRYFPVAVGIQADVFGTIKALIEKLSTPVAQNQSQKNWLSAFHTNWCELQNERKKESQISTIPLHPRRALAEIRATLPTDAVVTLDTGNACLQAADRLAHYQCPGLVTPLDFGLVGFGYAAALGVKAATPKRTVVSIMGDGGFGFTMSEITTAVRYNLAVIAIILDNGAWGAEKAYQNEFFAGRLIGANIDSPPFDEVAQLCGAKGYRVDRPGDLSVALVKAIAEGLPTVIHVMIDPDELSTLRKDLFKSPIPR